MSRRTNTPLTAIRAGVKRLVSPSGFRARQEAVKPQTIPKLWHAVCVDAKSWSCSEAQELRKKRFLSKDAPLLPLEGCSNPDKCPCTYKHYDDRRGKSRRDEEAKISRAAKGPASERRQSRGRRSVD
jgi:hypothetical protein